MDSDVEVARARLGRTVGDRWRLERVLGTGGMGAVYAARAPDGTIAAVKILHPEMGARREVRERFLREGWAANKIGHPGVVQMLGQGDGDEAFLVMELLEGETLRDRVRRHGRLPFEEVLDTASQVLEVLVAAHERGVIHRDLKPDNLFVTLDGRLKVLDFGLARLLDDVPGRHQTRTGVALGTLAYMAPEQALGRRGEIDGRADLFALGATLFRVLSGRHVHEGESEAELLMAMASRPAPPLKAVAPEVPDGVAAVVDLALAFARDARYPDARTMLADVTAVRRGGWPPFASARLASRDGRTRPDRPAFAPVARAPELASAPLSQRTQPLPVSQRTVPLLQYTEPASPYGATARAPAPPPSAPGAPVQPPAPVSARTELLAQMPPASAPSSASATQGVAAARRRRGLLAALIASGLFVVLGAGGAAAYFFLGSSSAAPEPTPIPSGALGDGGSPAPPRSPAGSASVAPLPSPTPALQAPADAGARVHVPRGHSRKAR